MIRSPAAVFGEVGVMREVSSLTGSLLEIVMYRPLGVRFTLNIPVELWALPVMDRFVWFASSLNGGWTMIRVALTTPSLLGWWNELLLMETVTGDSTWVTGEGVWDCRWKGTKGRGPIRWRLEERREDGAEEGLLGNTEDQGLLEFTGGRFSYTGWLPAELAVCGSTA